MGSMVYTYDASRRMHFGWMTPQHPPTAWILEALPWAIACAAALASAMLACSFRTRKFQFGLPCLIGLAVAAWLAVQPISYSTDIFRYLWDGRLLAHGVNPYSYVPADPHLSLFRHWPYWSLMGWKHMPEAYPPLAQIYFGVIAVITNGSVVAYKLLLLVNGAVSVALFYVVLAARHRAADIPPSPNRDIRQFALFTLFPPLLMESYGAGHVDTFAIPWMLLAWLWALRRKPIGVGFAIAMATAIKLYPVVLFAALWDIRRKGDIFKSLAAFVVTTVVLTVPFLSAGRGLIAYFHHVGAIAYDGSISALLSDVIGPAFDRHATLLVVAMVGIAWLLILFTRARDLPLERKACLLGLSFLLASPLMHPWYALSLLPFAIGGDELATLWLAVSVHWTYDELPQDVPIEYMPTYAWYLWGWTAPWRRRR